MVLMNLFAEQKWRHRHREQTCGHKRKGKGWTNGEGSIETYKFSSVQFSRSVVSDSLRPHGLQHARPPGPSPTPRIYQNSSIEPVMPSNHLILCHSLILLPSIFPSIRVFTNKSALRIRWPKY